MRRIHIAISTQNIEQSITDYTSRLCCEPEVVVPGEYALFRTQTVNFSIRRDSSVASGTLRHLGFEDDDATSFTSEPDVNGIYWEQFNDALQKEEILNIWPDVQIASLHRQSK